MTAKKAYRPPAPLDTVRIGVSVRIPTRLGEQMLREMEAARSQAVKEIAHRFFQKTQQNIKDMRISDRGLLLRSGRIWKIEGEDAWAVGYSAPYARYIDEGTGPLAGHPRYSAPPPYENIYGWVKRNLAVFGVKSFARKNSSRPLLRPRFKRIKRGDQTIYVLKPTKPSERLTGSYGKTSKKVDEDEEKLDDLTKRIQMKIFRVGTKPHPFWRKALAEVRIESRHLEREEYMKGVRNMLKRSLMKAFKSALKQGINVAGGRLKSW